MDSDQVLLKGPHAFPFRMIDRVVEIESGKKAVAMKNVSIDEFSFSASLDRPVMPWVLILEALTQTAGLACYGSEGVWAGGIGVPALAAVERFRVSGDARPGDQIVLSAEIERIFSSLVKVSALATINGRTLAEARLTLANVTMDQE
jgi:3-hydroxyacyl-[acyl-carrier-protein] dehydratase